MTTSDVALEKKKFRENFLQKRDKLSSEQKKNRDYEIAMRLLSCKEYMETKILLCYVSFGSEIDTKAIIHAALVNKKQVAVPKSDTKNHTLTFYCISSIEDLVEGNYGILEPKDGCPPVKDFSQSLCLVPALGYDIKGFRVGYGKGFYDRFLAQYTGTSVGLCYNECVTFCCPTEEHDCKVDVLVTPEYIRRLTKSTKETP